MNRLLPLGILLALAATGCESTKRSVDVFTRAEYIVTHWDEVRSREMCTETFCRRTDTTQKYVGGNPGHASETTYDYCPIHAPRFARTGSRFDDLLRFFHFGWAALLSYAMASLVFAAAYAPFVYAYAAIQRRRERTVDARMAIGGLAMFSGMLVTLAVYVLFFWI